MWGLCFYAGVNLESPGVPDERASCWIRQRADGDVEECVRVLAKVHARDSYPVNWPDQPGEWLSCRLLLGSWVAGLDGDLVGHV